MAALMRRDEEIRGHLVDEMVYDPTVTVHDLSIVVEHGHVILNGVVDWYGTRKAAEQAAWRVSGVTSVRNDIVVQPGPIGVADDVIAADLRERLDKEFLVPGG